MVARKTFDPGVTPLTPGGGKGFRTEQAGEGTRSPSKAAERLASRVGLLVYRFDKPRADATRLLLPLLAFAVRER